MVVLCLLIPLVLKLHRGAALCSLSNLTYLQSLSQYLVGILGMFAVLVVCVMVVHGAVAGKVEIHDGCFSVKNIFPKKCSFWFQGFG